MCSVRDDIDISYLVFYIHYKKCDDVVVLGQEDKMQNHIVSLIEILLYKYWLSQNQGGNPKSLIYFKGFIAYELSYRLKIYKAMENNYLTL